MLKTMLFSGLSGSGSESWALWFNDSNGNFLLRGISGLSIGKNGILYIGGTSDKPLVGSNKKRIVLFAKINDKGEILWQNYFNHESNNTESNGGYTATVGSDIIIGGQETNSSGRKTDTQLGLCSANGDELAITGITAPKSILGIPANVPILGISSNNNYVYVYGNYIAKLAKNLSSAEWIKPILKDTTFIVKCDPDNDYIYFYKKVSNAGFYIGSLSSTGELRWSEKIGGSNSEGTNICVANDAVYVCGDINRVLNSNTKYTNGIIAKYTKSGSLLWIKEITLDRDISYYIHPNTIGSDNIGNIYIGSIYKQNKYLIKLSPDGNILSNIKITYSGNYTSLSNIQTDTRGNVYFLIESDTNGPCLVKLTKNDIKQIATTPLSIGPVTFESDSTSDYPLRVVPSSISTASDSTGIIDNKNSTKYSLITSTFTFTESNLTPILYYKG